MTKCLCIHCNKMLANKYNLERHQKTEKCLDNQKKKNTDELKEKLEKANKKIEELYEWKEKQFEKLQKDLDKKDKFIMKQASKSKTTINNTINHMPVVKLDLSEEIVIKVFEKFKKDFFKMSDGIIQFAKFVFKNFLVDENGNLKYTCTDISRKTFKFRDKDDNIIPDPYARKITKTIMDIAYKKYIRPSIRNLKDELIDTEDENYTYIIDWDNCSQADLDMTYLKHRNEHPKYCAELVKQTYLGPKNRILSDEEMKKIKFEEKKIEIILVDEENFNINNKETKENKNTRKNMRDNIYDEEILTAFGLNNEEDEKKDNKEDNEEDNKEDNKEDNNEDNKEDNNDENNKEDNDDEENEENEEKDEKDEESDKEESDKEESDKEEKDKEQEEVKEQKKEFKPFYYDSKITNNKEKQEEDNEQQEDQDEPNNESYENEEESDIPYADDKEMEQDRQQYKYRGIFETKEEKDHYDKKFNIKEPKIKDEVYDRSDMYGIYKTRYYKTRRTEKLKQLYGEDGFYQICKDLFLKSKQ
jgi:hypothetical protein